VNTTAIGLTLLAIVFGVLFTVVVLSMYFVQYANTRKAEMNEGVGSSEAYLAYRDQSEAQLGSLEWVDRAAGTVNLPLDDAMDAVVAEYALPGMSAAGEWVAPRPAAAARHAESAAHAAITQTTVRRPPARMADRDRQTRRPPDRPASPPGRSSRAPSGLAASLTVRPRRPRSSRKRSPSRSGASRSSRSWATGSRPGSRFTDSSGETVALSSIFDGDKPVVVAPVYFGCPVVCPLILDRLTNSFRELDYSIGEDFEFVVASIDPGEGPTESWAAKTRYSAAYTGGADRDPDAVAARLALPHRRRDQHRAS
jgi:hypothetical protein